MVRYWQHLHQQDLMNVLHSVRIMISDLLSIFGLGHFYTSSHIGDFVVELQLLKFRTSFSTLCKMCSIKASPVFSHTLKNSIHLSDISGPFSLF